MKTKINNFNATDLMIRYEETGLNEADTILLFQYLVDTGMAWRLQGFYGRQAMALSEMGLVTRPEAEEPPEPDMKSKPKRRGRPSAKQRAPGSLRVHAAAVAIAFACRLRFSPLYTLKKATRRRVHARAAADARGCTSRGHAAGIQRTSAL